MKEIQLTQGKVALVDDDDYDYLMQWKWYTMNDTRANFFRPVRMGKDGKTVYMHRVIMNCPNNMLVDHINRDTLDNRRENLRICNKKQNNVNSIKSRVGTSGYKGVTYEHRNHRTPRWVSQIEINGKNNKIGRFKSKISAALAYDCVAECIHGEFAYLNFPAYIGDFGLNDRINDIKAKLGIRE